MGRAIKRIKEQLRAIPGRGLGYGLLRYMHPESKTRLAGHPEPQIGFNYLGRFSVDEGKDWSPAAQGASLVGLADLEMPMAHLIDINAMTLDGPAGPCLSTTWSWASALVAESEARSLAEGWRQALEALVHHVQKPGAGGHRFQTSRWWPCRLGRWNSWKPPIRLWKTFSRCHLFKKACFFTPSTIKVRRTSTPCKSALSLKVCSNVRRMQCAVKALMRRHAILRAAFFQEGLEHPVQVIVRDVDVPWREEDLSALDGESQRARLKELLTADLAERFDTSAAPLLRFALLRLGRERNVLVFTNHHLLFDGWSLPVFLGELLALYRNGGHEAALPRVRP